MKISSLVVHIVGGEIKPRSEAHKSLIRRFLSQYDGTEVRLEITPLKSKRSEEQNRYYWLFLSIIEEETGNDKDTLHAYFKGKFLTKSISEMYGDKVRVTRSTADLSRAEFCEYLLDISHITGVELPDTNEYWGYSYHK